MMGVPVIWEQWLRTCLNLVNTLSHTWWNDSVPNIDHMSPPRVIIFYPNEMLSGWDGCVWRLEGKVVC